MNNHKIEEENKKIVFTKKIFEGITEIEIRRRILLFISLRKSCFNCTYLETKIDSDSNLVICPVLKKPICYTCKNSDAFKLISATSAARKFKVDKKGIDLLNLPYLDVPNPYYTAMKMKLYYEFMIEQNL